MDAQAHAIDSNSDEILSTHCLHRRARRLLKQAAEVSVTEISNIGSPSMTAAIQLKLAQAINAALAKPEIAGAVVTHGTGTLEETAYFL